MNREKDYLGGIMRRFSYAVRSKLFIPNSDATVLVKREMGVPSSREIKFMMGFVFSAGFTVVAALIMSAYKIGRYIEKLSEKDSEVKVNRVKIDFSKHQENERGQLYMVRDHKEESVTSSAFSKSR